MAKFTKEEIENFMNAETARNNSILPQLKSVFNEIQEAVNLGRQSTSLMFQTLYPEVTEQLTELGYDVTIEEHSGDFPHSSTRISWKQGNKTSGKLEKINR